MSNFGLEFAGTAMLVLLGNGSVAAVLLARSKALSSGWVVIILGWGIAVYAGVSVAWASGAHINPAVTLGLLARRVANGEDADLATVGQYLTAQLLGAIVGAVLVYLVYKKHYDAEEDAGLKLATFSTGPAIKSHGWNIVTEAVGTFVLVFVILSFSGGGGPAALGALPVALLVIGIGASLGGPTGYAINPARDLGPRIAHALLPIKGKGSSDWGYSWVPVVGPILGGVAAGVVSLAFA